MLLEKKLVNYIATINLVLESFKAKVKLKKSLEVCTSSKVTEKALVKEKLSVKVRKH